MPSNDRSKLSRRNMVRALALGGLGLSAHSAVQAQQSVSPPSTGEVDQPNEADLGFLADMTAHHVQALAMCQRVLGRATGDPVQAAAAEVLQNQAIEIGMMRAWLTDWGQSTVTPKLTMGWMTLTPETLDPTEVAAYCDITGGDGAGVPVEEMNGYASDTEMHELALADGIDKGRMWLQLMSAHHVGGVHMASAAQRLASVDKVLRLARIQAEVQTYEIDQYDLLLSGEYA